MSELSTNSILMTSALLHATFHNEEALTTLHTEEELSTHSTSSSSLSLDAKNTNFINYGSTPAEKQRDENVVSPDTTESTPPDDACLPSMINHVVSSEHSVEVSSPLGAPREVHFSDLPPLSLSDNEEFDGVETDQPTREEVEVLHQQLKNALADLSAEKAIRHRKEKSLVKLAKELNKRSVDTELKERKIMRLATSINTLQRTAEAEQERYRVSVIESDERATRLEDTISTLRTELYAAELQIDGLREQLATALSYRNRFYCWLVVGLVLVVIATRSAATITLRNSICAPLAPGTKLFPNQQTGVYEGPWWAPVGMKEMNNKFLCNNMGHNAVQSKIKWKGDRLMVHDNNNNVVYQGRGSAGVTIDANVITLSKNKKNGETIESVVPAPWAIEKW